MPLLNCQVGYGCVARALSLTTTAIACCVVEASVDVLSRYPTEGRYFDEFYDFRKYQVFVCLLVVF